MIRTQFLLHTFKTDNYPKIWVGLVFVFMVWAVQGQDLPGQERLRKRLHAWERKQDFNPTDTTYINLLNNLAYELRYYDLDSLHLLSQKALNYSQVSNYHYGEGRATHNLGTYYSDKGDYRAIAHFKEALEIFQNIDEHLFLNETGVELADEYSKRGNFALALDQHLQNIELAKISQDSLWISINNSNIGILYCDLKDFDEGVEYLRESLKISLLTNDHDGSAIYRCSLAWALSELKDYTEALLEINKAISHLEKNRIKDWLAYAYSIKGGIYIGLGKYKWAAHWLNQANALHEELDDDRSMLNLYSNMVKAHIGLGDMATAETFADKAYVLAQKINFPDGIRTAAEAMYQIKKEQGNDSRALHYLEIMRQISDSLYRDENRNSLLVQKSRLDFEKQKEEALITKEQDLKRQRYINYGIILLGLVLVASLVFYRKGALKQRKLIEELRHNTLALQKKEGELQEINNTKDKLFSIIGHDLRSPIAALQDLLRLFGEGDLEKEQLGDYIPKLRKDVDHIWFTLNNLLSWSRSQMRGENSKPKKIVLEALLEENINFLSELAANKNILIQNNLPGKTTAWADADQINVVFRNLLSNALKFTKKNGLVVVDIEDRDSLWELQVQDTGIGIAPETLEHLFDKNRNQSTYGTNNEKGTGIGLGLCREMVEKNGGTVWATSAQDLGSTFYFTIPKKKSKTKKTTSA
ncbi:tetratricopeptide repeat-containing sensor histidine kinase [Sediminicola luteus]|uniref:histidine kinase n=1 Tax=Sediminicola luteus TaxID=319238 RepID=A0A2A4G6P9_9FLAO|nr:tetratricopeptide repeat-containing sensor histidine kinase [Sediminicola luteus]PCE64111.1 hypothetical protein B7P33_12830 [Sediminicola luteus]